jgi:glycosyltransferase involved in cell wall biosynthesis
VAEPFFSILLPTKNRSEILPGAIRSVLEQTFGDFELVISDNDDSPTATREAVAQFNDPRVRYVRTSGDLAMHANWDNAFFHATGKHVLVLEDKMRLVTNALEVLHEAVRKEETVVSYPLTFIKGERLRPSGAPPSSQVLESTRIIDGFTRFKPTAFDLIPKGLDCCAPRELLRRIKEESPTGFLFSHVCPDYAFGFMVLSRVDRITHLDAPLAYIPNNWMWAGKYSNGQATYRKDALIRRFMKDLPVTTMDIIERVPVKAEYLWINMVLYDFFTKYRRSDHLPRINWIDYHAFVQTLILLGRKLGADMADERAAIRASLRQQSRLFRLQVAVKFFLHLVLAAQRAVMARLAANRDRNS